MKKTILLFIILCTVENAYSQDVQHAYDKKVLEVDSLKKANISLHLEITNLQMKIKENDSICKQKEIRNQNLQKEISALEKYKTEKKAIERKLSLKSDTISIYRNEITAMKSDNKTTDEKCKKDLVTEKENGKKEILLQVANTYRNNKFDDLIISSSIASIGFDKQLLSADTTALKTISYLEIYFKAERLLSLKFNDGEVKNAISQLNLIKVQSDLVNTLKDDLDNFRSLNENLKTSLQEIIAIDKGESVEGLSKEIMDAKNDKINRVISLYIFNYDFDSAHYPYLSSVILEVIKKKQPNPDADISDLLNKF